MKLRISLTLVIFTTFLAFSSCARRDTGNTSTAGALGSNATAAKMFDRRNLGVAGFHVLNDFIRADVRERLDKEPISQDEEALLSAAETDASGDISRSGETEAENGEDVDDPETKTRNLDKLKFSWATKKFGDALAADPNLSGAIVLYADENYYDINRLLRFVDEGRDRISADSGIEGSRIQVVFGGYRGVAQVEMWVIPAGGAHPELKPEDRDASGPDS